MDPLSVWIRESESSGGSRAFSPNHNNTRFLFNDNVGVFITHLVAVGSPMSVPSSSKVLSATTPSDSNPPLVNAQFSYRKAHSCNVKIVQASINRSSTGKIEFKAENQTFVDVNDSTANVHYVTSVIQRKWGAEYCLVTADGLKLDDSCGTQG